MLRHFALSRKLIISRKSCAILQESNSSPEKQFRPMWLDMGVLFFGDIEGNKWRLKRKPVIGVKP